MTRIITLAIACALVAACGAPLAGTYSGTLTTQVTCPGEPPATNLDTITMTVVETADGAALETARCGTVRGTVEGSTLRLKEHTCPPQTLDSGASVTLTFTPPSSVTVADDSLSVSLHARARIGTTDCAMLQSGTLARD